MKIDRRIAIKTTIAAIASATWKFPAQATVENPKTGFIVSDLTGDNSYWMSTKPSYPSRQSYESLGMLKGIHHPDVAVDFFNRQIEYNKTLGDSLLERQFESFSFSLMLKFLNQIHSKIFDLSKVVLTIQFKKNYQTQFLIVTKHFTD